MILLNLEQGSPEWEMARLGIPTASAFDRIITPKTLKLSAQAAEYRNQLLAEWLLGYPIDWSGQSAWMDRGKEMEDEARAWYEMHSDVDVALGGFVLRDDRATGGSPDGLVGEDGGCEIKCPALHTHIGYLLDPDSLVAEYRGQTQGYMYLSGRAWWDVISYNPELPKVVVRIPRDEAYIAALETALNAFLKDLEEAKTKLQSHRSVGVTTAPVQEAAAPAEAAAAVVADPPRLCGACGMMPHHQNCPEQDAAVAPAIGPVEAMVAAAKEGALKKAAASSRPAADRKGARTGKTKAELNAEYHAKLADLTEWGTAERKLWQEQRIGKASCTTWEVEDYELALLLISRGELEYQPPLADYADPETMPV